MFGWVHKKKITKLAEAARAFVDANYKELPKNSTRTSEGVRYSRRLNNDNLPKFSRETEPQIKYSLSEEPESKPEDDHVQYSLRDPQVKYSDRDIRYSLRDNYDSRSIDRAVRSLSSTESPLRALRTLEDSTNMSFVDKMLDYINIKHMRDSDVYKAAQVDRRLFSKIV